MGFRLLRPSSSTGSHLSLSLADPTLEVSALFLNSEQYIVFTLLNLTPPKDNLGGTTQISGTVYVYLRIISEPNST